MLVDSHCHLADDAFVDDLEAVISRAREARLAHALCIIAAENRVEQDRAASIAERWPAVRFGVGLHPHHAGLLGGREDDVLALVRDAVAAVPGTRAIGEIGLDYHYDFAPRAVQQLVFRHQIRLARELDLPVIIHTREAEDDTMAILREESGGALRGVLHCFTGSAALAAQALELGMHISFAGIVTFPRAGELRAVVPQVPDDRVLCETDSPYLAPTPFRGKRNEPAWVVRVVEDLAAMRGTTVDRLADRIAANFAALFSP
jgi:TatD DNase family protein